MHQYSPFILIFLSLITAILQVHIHPTVTAKNSNRTMTHAIIAIENASYLSQAGGVLGNGGAPGNGVVSDFVPSVKQQLHVTLLSSNSFHAR